MYPPIKPVITTTHKPTTCKCGAEFIPQVGFNGIVVSKYCQQCRYENEIAKRRQRIGQSIIQKPKGLKTGLKSNSTVVRKSRTTDYSKTDHKHLLKLAVKYFNAFIRKRDELPNKTFYCPTCGKYKRIIGDNYQACHVFPAGHCTALRFNELNVWGGCKACNYHKHGVNYIYNDWLRNKIGEQEYQKLQLMSNASGKMERFELIQVIEVYKAKLK